LKSDVKNFVDIIKKHFYRRSYATRKAILPKDDAITENHRKETGVAAAEKRRKETAAATTNLQPGQEVVVWPLPSV
jgi:D-lyxose ketol-isomerase